MTRTITCPVCGEVMFDVPTHANESGFPCSSCGAILFLPEHDRLLSPTASSPNAQTVAEEGTEDLNRRVSTIWDETEADFEVQGELSDIDPPSDHEIRVSFAAGSDSAWLIDLNKQADLLTRADEDNSNHTHNDGGDNTADKTEPGLPNDVLDERTHASSSSSQGDPGDTLTEIESPTPAEPPRRSRKELERERRTVRVYLSATPDLAAERVLASQILTRMAVKYVEVLDLETYVFDHGGVDEEIGSAVVGPDSANIVFLLVGRLAGLRLPATCPEERRAEFRSGTEYELQAALTERAAPGTLVFLHHGHTVAAVDESSRTPDHTAAKLSELLETWLVGTDAPAAESYVPVSTGAEVVQEIERRLASALDAIVAERNLQPRERADDDVPRWWTHGSPYRALAPFSRADAEIFEGRTQATCELVTSLKKQALSGKPWVLLAGPAGCGKTSLARAGLAGLITQPGVVPGVSAWRECVFRPGDATESLVDALAFALMDYEVLPELGLSGMNPGKLAQIMKKNPRGLARQLETALDGLAATGTHRGDRSEARLFLVVDALEEVYAGEQFPAEERALFFSILAGLVTSRSVWVAATVRSEFVELVSNQPELAPIQPQRALYHVTEPSEADLERMVGIPAEAAGLWFGKDPASGKWLDRQIVEEAVAAPDRLWELSYLLQGLYDRRTPRGKITQAALDELGGMAQALSTVAEARLAKLPPATSAALPRLAKELVEDYESTGILLPKTTFARYFAKDLDLAPLVEALVEIGVLTRRKPYGGSTQLRLASMGVISSWPRFAEAFEASRQMPKFDPAASGGSSDSSAEIDVSGLAAAESSEEAIEGEVTDTSIPSPVVVSPSSARERALKIAGGVMALLLLSGGWWWGMRPYLFPRNARLASSAPQTESVVPVPSAQPERDAPRVAVQPLTKPSVTGPQPAESAVVAAVNTVEAPAVTANPVSNAPIPVATEATASPGENIASRPPEMVAAVTAPNPLEKPAVPPDLPKPTPAPPPAPITYNVNLGSDEEFRNSLGMRLRLIPSGEFDMGSPAGESGRHDDEPRRHVRISKPFYMGVHEVTQGQFEELMGRQPSGFKGKALPVENVSWSMAVDFCQMLSEREAEKSHGVKYRLPTEAEWEYACRAGSPKAFHFGNAASSRDANFDGTQPYGNGKPGPDLAGTTRVGSYAPNAWGLHDMHGNVAEWCADWFARSIDMNATASPLGAPTGTRRVIRGGSWLSAGCDCRSAWRGSEAPNRFDSILGFRVVADIPE